MSEQNTTSRYDLQIMLRNGKTIFLTVMDATAHRNTETGRLVGFEYESADKKALLYLDLKEVVAIVQRTENPMPVLHLTSDRGPDDNEEG